MKISQGQFDQYPDESNERRQRRVLTNQGNYHDESYINIEKKLGNYEKAKRRIYKCRSTNNQIYLLYTSLYR